MRRKHPRPAATRRRSLAALAGLLALALSVTLAAGPSSAAKKGGKTKRFTETKVVNAAIPEAPAAGQPPTSLTSQIKVPKKYKGKVVGDLNVTGIQTTGNVPDAGNDLIAYLTAPNGRTVQLFFRVGAQSQSLGPWTLDDDTNVSICNQVTPPPCADPNNSLNPPYAGTSNLLENQGGFPPGAYLAAFNGVRMRGTWTLLVTDVLTMGGQTSTLNQWGLRIKAAKPVPES